MSLRWQIVVLGLALGIIQSSSADAQVFSLPRIFKKSEPVTSPAELPGATPFEPGPTATTTQYRTSQANVATGGFDSTSQARPLQRDPAVQGADYFAPPAVPRGHPFSSCTMPAGAPQSCTAPTGLCPNHNCPANECGCGTPCGPTRKRPGEDEPTRPRPGTPEVSPGMYVAPPQTGAYQGGQRGIEFGGLALTFPEITLGLPKLRWSGRSHSYRGPQMRTDAGVAPYVTNPYYAQAQLLQQMTATGGANGSREGDDDSSRTREGGDDDSTKKRGGSSRSCTSSSDQALNERIDRLERCLEQQCKILNQSVAVIQGMQPSRRADEWIQQSPGVDETPISILDGRIPAPRQPLVAPPENPDYTPRNPSDRIPPNPRRDEVGAIPYEGSAYRRTWVQDGQVQAVRHTVPEQPWPHSGITPLPTP